MGVGAGREGEVGGGVIEWIKGVVSFAVCYLAVCQAACFERRKQGAGAQKERRCVRTTNQNRMGIPRDDELGTRPDLHFVPRWNISHVLSLQA